MNSLLLLVPISLLLLALAIWAFVAAVRSGQFEDLDTPGLDILRDEKIDSSTPELGSPEGNNDAY